MHYQDNTVPVYFPFVSSHPKITFIRTYFALSSPHAFVFKLYFTSSDFYISYWPEKFLLIFKPHFHT